MRLEGIRAGYHGKECLKGVSAEFRAGEMTGIIGPNGAGKSTLMRAAAGQLALLCGHMELDGKAIEHDSPKMRARKLAYMPQMRALPEMTVRQMAEQGRYPHLEFGRSLNSEDHEKVEEALRLARADDLADRMVRDLSGGEQQRACLAMALAQDTPWLLMDEPAAHLDIWHQFDLMELLGDLRKRGKSIVIVLHELQLALSYCDRLLLMRDGCALMEATPREMIESGVLEETFCIELERASKGGYAFRRKRESGREES